MLIMCVHVCLHMNIVVYCVCVYKYLPLPSNQHFIGKLPGTRWVEVTMRSFICNLYTTNAISLDNGDG